MGLGNVVAIEGVPPTEEPSACVGKMEPASAGKDSTAGHWELMGCILDEPFPTYPNGFPSDVVSCFEEAIGARVLGNRPASGTAIIQELGLESRETKRPILYTSQDSVFQLAAHESVTSTGELYRWCDIARKILVPPHGVARVIARPFAGEPGGFFRTPARRDFSLPPAHPTVLDMMEKSDKTVVAVGKVNDLFAGRGIMESRPTKDNRQGMDATLQAMKEKSSLVFTNLVDFDTMWGHRNDPRAYALGLEEFDSYLNVLIDALDDDTLLIITSDHGNDPTTVSTDHSRECVPLIVYHRGLASPRSLGVRTAFADVGKTVAENFALDERPSHGMFPGTSFLGEVTS
jgi:phosphopentomutase